MIVDLHTTGRRRPLPSARHLASTVGVAALGAITAAWSFSTLIAIANFALRYPAFDQFRLYPIYLELPFPQNAIQIENGHRPILPALLRLLEIRWSNADQNLQLIAGGAALLATLFAILLTIARERAIAPLARAAACVSTVLAFCWLGNARMLMHANELEHVYFVTLFVVLALLALYRGAKYDSSGWVFLAVWFCVGATFTFGSGVASFGALLISAVLLRLRIRYFFWPILSVAASFLIYLFMLPSGGNVRASLALDLERDIVLPLQWLAAPWMRAWLGHAEPTIDGSIHQGMLAQHGIGDFLTHSANALAYGLGVYYPMGEAAAVGAIGLIAYILMMLHAFRRRGVLNRPQALAVGLSTFAAAVSLLVCLARKQAFAMFPLQVFADRYLPWSCMFWLGLAVYAIAAPTNARWREWAVAALALVTSALLVPSHLVMAGWSAAVHRNVQQSAVAAQLGVWDPQRFPDNADARRADVLRTLNLLRRDHLSMYAEPAYRLVERGWRAPLPLPTDLTGAHANVVREFDDTLGSHRVAAFEGVLPNIEKRPREPVLVVVDEGGQIRGLAKTSFIGWNRSNLRFDIPQKQGFDGYVLNPEPGETLRIVVLDDSQSSVLAAIPLRIPDIPPAS